MIEKHALAFVTWKAMWRRWSAGILLIAVAALGVCGAVVLQNLSNRQEAALDRTISNTTISCIVTDAKGTNSNNLYMISTFVEMLDGRRAARGCTLGDYVTHVRAKAESFLDLPEGASLRRILSLDSDPALDPVGGASVQFYPGWTEEALRSRQQVCLVSDDLLNADGYQTIADSIHDKTVRLEIIGTISGGPTRTIYCPFYMPWTEGESEAFTTDSCSFEILDNRKLEESKAAIYEWFVLPDRSYQIDGITFGVLVQDEIYQNTLQEIQSNLSMLQLLQPALLVLFGSIGFFSSYLATRTRAREFAVMRCLGMSRWLIFKLVMAELIFFSLSGAAIGFGIGFLIEQGVSAKAAASAVCMTIIFILGSAIAAFRSTGVNVMKLMKVED